MKRHAAPNGEAADRRPPHGSANPLDTDARIKERGSVQHGIADADKVARTGSKDETVRNTPPAGAWNDVSKD